MKPVMGVVLALLASSLLFTPSAKAWGCTDPAAKRVDVGNVKPAGDIAGDADGQYYIGGDAPVPTDYYVCEPPTPPPPPPPPPPTPTTSNSTSSASAAASAAAAANSSSNSSSNQTQSQKQSQVANGGTANATGGSVGNVTSTSSVSNSGNSSNSNKNVAKGGQGGAGGSSVATATGNGVGNGNNSNDTTIKEPNQTPPAIAAVVVPTAPCTKGGSIAGSGGLFSFGVSGNKIDDNCAALEASRMAPSILARCMIFIQTKYAVRAGVSLDQCLPPTLPPQIVVQAPIPAPVAPQIVEMPAPIVNITIMPPPPPPAPSVVAAAVKNGHIRHVTCEPAVPNGPKGCKKVVIDNDALQLHQ